MYNIYLGSHNSSTYYALFRMCPDPHVAVGVASTAEASYKHICACASCTSISLAVV